MNKQRIFLKKKLEKIFKKILKTINKLINNKTMNKINIRNFYSKQNGRIFKHFKFQINYLKN